MSDAVPSTAVAHVFHPDDPRAPNGDPRAFWSNHCENIDSQESEDGMVMLTASCPLCPARSGSRFWLPKYRDWLDDVLAFECGADAHPTCAIIDFILADYERRKAEKKAYLAKLRADIERRVKSFRSYIGEDGIPVFVTEYHDGMDPADPVRLRDLLFSPTRDSMRTTPLRRTFLLTVPGDGTGVFPAGKVGVLSAPGGTGKSYALMHLALAVATGMTAYGEGEGWKAEAGRVLFLFGEDDRDEIERRLHHVFRASGIISDDDVALLERNLDLMPLCGQPVALTTSLDSELAVLPETRRCEEIREILKAAMDDERPYALVVLDPLSRFAGTDVETDNAAATRFVQVLESFTSAEFGNPSIIISAHERKAMKEDDPDSADPMRGSSALKDAFRWVARLQQRRRKEGAPDLLKLRVVKTNLTKPGLYLDLCRPPDWHGALRIATAGEIEAYEQTAGRARRETGISLTEKIIDELSRGAASGNELRGRLHVGKPAVNEGLDQLEADGRIERLGQKWTLRAATPGAATP